ncbi:MAG: bifunctional homocysteine S-methyltransferase/methylenetetrahydrofolate reductase [Planctomycetota bacterium]
MTATAETTLPFQEALKNGVLTFDGAMGTEIYRANVFTNRCFDELCLSNPDLVRRIHDSYLEAGVDVLTTNSFGANRVALVSYGLGDQMEAINMAAAHLARAAGEEAGRPVYVAGSIGPVQPEGGRTVDIPAVLREQAHALDKGGVDVLFFETQPTREAVEACALAMQGGPDLPYMISCAIQDNGESIRGEPLDRMLAPLPEGTPAPLAWGLNCGVGPDAMLDLVEKAVKLIDRPLIVQPNAGEPREVNHRRIYMCSPEYLSTYARRYLELGAAAVGGCCGTTPEQMDETVRAIKPLTRRPVASIVHETPTEAEPQEPTPFGEKTRFSCALATGRWVATVELVPPRGYDLSGIVEKARVLHRRGVDAINLPDGPRASSRISPLTVANEIQREAQIEAILHFCARDRNLIGMQADLLACAACGVRNILFITGDPPKLGNYPDASGVFDADSIDLCRLQDRLNRGLDLGGQALTPPTQAVVGVGADPSAVDPDREIRRYREKAEAGAEYVITQPVFDPEALLRFLDRIPDVTIPVVAGIWPLASYRNASFMRNEVPGVTVPDAIMERMAAHEDRDDQRKEGIAIARESVDKLRDRLAGIQVSAPFGNIETAMAVIEG